MPVNPDTMDGDREVIMSTAERYGWTLGQDTDRWNTFHRGGSTVTVGWDPTFDTIASRMVPSGDTEYATTLAKVYTWLVERSPTGPSVTSVLSKKSRELKARAAAQRVAAIEAIEEVEEFVAPARPAPPIARSTVRFREMEF